MTLPMSFMEAAPVAAMARVHQRAQLVFVEGLGQVRLADADLEAFLLRQVFPVRLGVLLDGVAALLDHLVEHREYLRVVQLDTLVHLALLDGREYETDNAELALIGRLHRGLHVVLDALLKHGGRGCGSERAIPAPVLALQLLVMTFDRGCRLALALGGGLLVKLAAAYLGEDTRLLAGALESAQGDFERFVFLYADIRHERDFLDWVDQQRLRIKPRIILKLSPHLQSACVPVDVHAVQKRTV